MKGKVVFGALLVSVALCSQGFGHELLGRLLGLNCGGCGTCNACCEAACEEPAACEAPPARRPVNRPARGCEPACELRAGLRAGLRTEMRFVLGPEGPVRLQELQYGLQRVLRNAPRPALRNPLAAKLRPANAEVLRSAGLRSPEVLRSSGCLRHLLRQEPCRRPLLGLLDDLFGCRKCKGGCGGCGEPSCCEEACGCGECGGGEVATPAAAPSTAPAPAPAPAEEAAPLPQAPTADPSASLMRSRSIYQASRTVVRN